MNTSTDIMAKTRSMEHGIALPIVLIFLVVMMLLGVTTIRNVTLGEKMSGNLRNQQLAFQAAEQALRYCENDLLADVHTIPVKTPGLTSGSNNWEVASYWSNDGISVAVPAADPDKSGLAARPRCMVEDVKDILDLDPNENKKNESLEAYRITARGVGGTDNAVVMLQSYLRFN